MVSDRKAPLRACSVALLGASLALGGCNFQDRLRREWDALLILTTGKPSGGWVKGKGPGAARSPSPGSGDELQLGEAARRAKANAELLNEVYRVVLLREPSKGEFGSLVDTLNQGASIEGLYNGFTHSTAYRRLEAGAGAASAATLKAFGELLAELQRELPAPTAFDSRSAQPLEVLSASEVAGQATGKGAAGEISAERYSRIFAGASFYTLKRVAGDEALKVLAAKKAVPEQLALWYSKWVVQMASRQVDFGIEQRNRADEGFHRGWVAQVPADRLTWEILNRVHRVLNAAERRR